MKHLFLSCTSANVIRTSFVIPKLDVNSKLHLPAQHHPCAKGLFQDDLLCQQLASNYNLMRKISVKKPFLHEGDARKVTVLTLLKGQGHSNLNRFVQMHSSLNVVHALT